MTTREKRFTKKRRLVHGKISIAYNNPLTNTSIHNIKDIDVFLNRDDNVMIFMNDEPIPFLMKRSYFANILFDDIVYQCGPNSRSRVSTRRNQYYHLFKLFANHTKYKDIIIPLDEMDKIVKNRHINKYHIYSADRAINTIPKINVDLKTDPHADITNEENIGDILSNLSYYTGRGYSVANGYLVRTAYYPERRKLPEYANDIRDIEFASMMNFLTCGFYYQKKRTEYEHVRIRAVEKMIHDVDLAFMKIAPRTTETMFLRRGVGEYYPYLRKIGDRMVIENYISTTKHMDIQFGAKEYYVEVSPGIPYIDYQDSKNFEDVFMHTNEREVILPKNLLAELIKIEDVDHYTYPRHTIRLSLLYKGQYDLDENEKCKERNLFHIQPFIKRDNYSARSARSARSNRRSAFVSNSI